MERNSKSVRHSFEHQMLRDYYMKNPTDFVDTMGRDGTLYRVYDSVCRKHGEENPYRPEQYSADMLTAPVEAGAQLGELTVECDGETLAVLPLIAEGPVEKLTWTDLFTRLLCRIAMGPCS